MQHLLFYTLAAAPHPGQDGAPRKAILRHQVPHPYSYPPHHPSYQTPADYAMDEDDYAHASGSAPAVGPSSGLAPAPAYRAAQVYEPSVYPGYVDQSPLYPSGPSQPQPGNFANAGPAGYLYDPHSMAYEYAATPVAPGHAAGVNPHSQAQAYAAAQAALAGQGYAPAPGSLVPSPVYPNPQVHALSQGHAPGHGRGQGQGQGHAQWQSRSEWSSPVRPAWQYQ